MYLSDHFIEEVPTYIMNANDTEILPLPAQQEFLSHCHLGSVLTGTSNYLKPGLSGPRNYNGSSPFIVISFSHV